MGLNPSIVRLYVWRLHGYLDDDSKKYFKDWKIPYPRLVDPLNHHLIDIFTALTPYENPYLLCSKHSSNLFKFFAKHSKGRIRNVFSHFSSHSIPCKENPTSRPWLYLSQTDDGTRIRKEISKTQFQNPHGRRRSKRSNAMRNVQYTISEVDDIETSESTDDMSGVDLSDSLSNPSTFSKSKHRSIGIDGEDDDYRPDEEDWLNDVFDDDDDFLEYGGKRGGSKKKGGQSKRSSSKKSALSQKSASSRKRRTSSSLSCSILDGFGFILALPSPDTRLLSTSISKCFGYSLFPEVGSEKVRGKELKRLLGESIDSYGVDSAFVSKNRLTSESFKTYNKTITSSITSFSTKPNSTKPNSTKHSSNKKDITSFISVPLTNKSSIQSLRKKPSSSCSSSPRKSSRIQGRSSQQYNNQAFETDHRPSKTSAEKKKSVRYKKKQPPQGGSILDFFMSDEDKKKKASEAKERKEREKREREERKEEERKKKEEERKRKEKEKEEEEKKRKEKEEEEERKRKEKEEEERQTIQSSKRFESISSIFKRKREKKTIHPLPLVESIQELTYLDSSFSTSAQQIAYSSVNPVSFTVDSDSLLFLDIEENCADRRRTKTIPGVCGPPTSSSTSSSSSSSSSSNPLIQSFMQESNNDIYTTNTDNRDGFPIDGSEIPLSFVKETQHHLLSCDNSSNNYGNNEYGTSDSAPFVSSALFSASFEKLCSKYGQIQENMRRFLCDFSSRLFYFPCIRSSVRMLWVIKEQISSMALAIYISELITRAFGVITSDHQELEECHGDKEKEEEERKRKEEEIFDVSSFVVTDNTTTSYTDSKHSSKNRINGKNSKNSSLNPQSVSVSSSSSSSAMTSATIESISEGLGADSGHISIGDDCSIPDISLCQDNEEEEGEEEEGEEEKEEEKEAENIRTEQHGISDFSAVEFVRYEDQKNPLSQSLNPSSSKSSRSLPSLLLDRCSEYKSSFLSIISTLALCTPTQSFALSQLQFMRECLSVWRHKRSSTSTSTSTSTSSGELPIDIFPPFRECVSTLDMLQGKRMNMMIWMPVLYPFLTFVALLLLLLLLLLLDPMLSTHSPSPFPVDSALGQGSLEVSSGSPSLSQPQSKYIHTPVNDYATFDSESGFISPNRQASLACIGRSKEPGHGIECNSVARWEYWVNRENTRKIGGIGNFTRISASSSSPSSSSPSSSSLSHLTETIRSLDSIDDYLLLNDFSPEPFSYTSASEIGDSFSLYSSPIIIGTKEKEGEIEEKDEKDEKTLQLFFWRLCECVEKRGADKKFTQKVREDMRFNACYGECLLCKGNAKKIQQREEVKGSSLGNGNSQTLRERKRRKNNPKEWYLCECCDTDHRSSSVLSAPLFFSAGTSGYPHDLCCIQMISDMTLSYIVDTEKGGEKRIIRRGCDSLSWRDIAVDTIPFARRLAQAYDYNSPWM
ncbi:hypothetical protein ADUPG1_011853 [Aduncisulcus paluster]|uniref:Uncharacterized protein n=1 Tax=Aduncisulcus paluster TaxID=2918883 RepID=A0ABQ5JXD1_9EUKA|nr:hypothetical protein ADUPG1_011853 [Aduncisulcus paluster]